MATTFFSFLKQHKFPSRDDRSKLLVRPLSWYGAVLYVLIIAILVVIYIIIIQINSHFLVSVPARGGSLTEGMIGAPNLINPILASTQTDRDLVQLLYTGLVQKADDGSVVPDLAETYTLSPDGLMYTFNLREGLKWSDGNDLTSFDVAFTYATLANPLLHPNSAWQGVTVTTPDERTVILTLTRPNTITLEDLTIGIIPQHIWGDIVEEAFTTAPYNLKPVGSGAFAVASIEIEDSIPQSIVLKRNKHALADPYLKKYHINFYANQAELLTALDEGSIDMTVDATPATAATIPTDNYTVTNIETPRLAALYQLGSSPLFITREFVDILNRSIDKSQILATVDYGYGILPSDTTVLSLEDARSSLSSLGYSYNDTTLTKNGAPVTFSLAVENDPTQIALARALSTELADLGIVTQVKAFDYGTFNDAVRAREFQAIVATSNPSTLTGYEPVFPIYQSAIPLITKKNTHFSIPTYLSNPIDRYLEMEQWHARTNDVWNVFANGRINE